MTGLVIATSLAALAGICLVAILDYRRVCKRDNKRRREVEASGAAIHGGNP